MAGPLGVAYVDIEGRTDKLQAQVAGAVQGKFGPMGAAMGKDIISGAEGGVSASGGGLKSKIGGLFGSLKGMIAGAGIAMAGQAAFSFLKDSVTAASDAEESVNAVGLVFKDTADQITNFGKTAATEVGLSATAFQELATTTGALLKNKGVEDFTGKTIELTRRASDMASVFNTDVDTALGAIQSAIKGEFNPLEQFGVSLSAAALQERAMAETGKATAKELTDQEKATAALNMIMEQTEDTAGDFIATSDGLANSQRIVAAEWENSKAILGKALMPAITSLVGLLAKILPPVVQALVPIFDLFGEVLGELADMVGDVLPPLVEALIPILKMIGTVVKVAFNIIKPILKLALDQIRRLIDFVTAVFQGRWRDAWNAIKAYVTAPVRFIIDKVKEIPNMLRGIPGKMLEIGKNIISGLIRGIKSMLGRITSAIKETVMKPVNAVKRFLHIGSPSKLMEQWGAWTGEGFEKGLEKKARAVADAYGNLLPPDHVSATIAVATRSSQVSSVAAMAVPATRPHPSRTAAGVQVHNTFNAPVGGSMAQFGKAIAKQGALEMRFAHA